MKKFLFQGDSITDCSRNKEKETGRDIFNKGHGYATVTSAILGAEYPGEIEFINRGISGNRIVDVYARIKADIINLNPDYMSILIGINDVWHEISSKNGVAAEKFEKIYTMLIEEVLEALPDIKIFILAPFVLNYTATEEHFDIFRKECDLRTEAAKRVAEKFSLPFITLQDKFDEGLKKAPVEYWVSDGVHPQAPGHGLISKALIEEFKKIYNQ